jgi:hypothetical protein
MGGRFGGRAAGDMAPGPSPPTGGPPIPRGHPSEGRAVDQARRFSARHVEKISKAFDVSISTKLR